MAFKQLTTKEYKYRSIQVHKDRYNYSSTDFSQPTLAVLCNIHGVFTVPRSIHIKDKVASRCPKCERVKSILRSIKVKAHNKHKAVTTKVNALNSMQLQFPIDKLITLDYADLSITIRCAIHNKKLRVIPKGVSKYENTTTCSLCATDRIKKELLAAHNGDFSIYSGIGYKGNYTYTYPEVHFTKVIPKYIKVICEAHGEFLANRVKRRDNTGGHCPICTGTARVTKEAMLQRFVAVHGKNFDYSKVKFVTTNKPVTIRCLKCMTLFKTTPSNHEITLNGGCPSCTTGGFDDSAPAILYYLELDGGKAYKIGITNFTVKRRYIADSRINYKVLKVWKFSKGKDARNFETKVLKAFAHEKYEGEYLMQNTKNTEVFKANVLNL